jgi:quercetin dioxygenase-like cupin family protein
VALLIKGKDVKDGSAIVNLHGGQMATKFVYGTECNLMVATRAGGYHSKPHTHDSEQLNYVTDGEIWVFVDDTGFLAQKGDFYRVPKNAVHWGWIRSDKPCTIVECHSPAVEPGRRRNSIGLFAEGEAPDTSKAVPTVNVEIDTARIEEAVLGAAYHEKV